MIRRLLAGAALSAAVFAGPALAEGKLNIYNWAGYTPEDLVKKFEAETGVEVTIDTYDTNETLLAKLMAGGGGYDIIVTAHSFIPIHAGEKLIQPMGLKEMENYKYLDEQFKEANWNPEGDYAIPWQWGTTSFAVDTAAYDKPIDSYETLFSPPPELQGQVGMFKGQVDVITLAQLYLGIPFCSEEPAEMMKVLELLKAQKPHVKVYGGGASMREQLVSGELKLAAEYSGQVERGRREKASLSYIYPKEGVAGWVDVVAIPADAQNYENARKFVNFTLDPENAALITNHAGYASGVSASREFTKKELVEAPENNVPEGVKVIPLETCSAAANDLEAQVMTELME